MGTRSNTIIKNNDGNILVNMCRQSDGYLSGHGAELKKEFGNTKIINGFSSEESPKFANGMGCLSAQIIAHFKQEIGGFYIVSPKKAENDYCYVLYLKKGDNKISVKVKCSDKIIYDGLLSEMPTEEGEENE